MSRHLLHPNGGLMGHVLVIPKRHAENLYDIPDEDLAEVYNAVKKVAIAIRSTYNCDGTSTRQHNEPAGQQDVWHFHVHVFSRYEDDKPYQNHDQKAFIEAHLKDSYAEKLKAYFKSHSDQ
jgi:histidine triad (HIT) family protein